jgi:hypothetical protein
MAYMLTLDNHRATARVTSPEGRFQGNWLIMSKSADEIVLYSMGILVAYRVFRYMKSNYKGIEFAQAQPKGWQISQSAYDENYF